MISNYEEAKKNVLRMYYDDFLPLVDVIKCGKPASFDNSLQWLGTEAKKIEQGKFLLMVVGEAKSGKSTFINAYLGEEILPMDVKQCTSAIVEIRYGKEFTLKATYADDREKVFKDEGQIKAFLTANAALDDGYRDIPVSMINFRLLMPKKGEKVRDSEIVELLRRVENENIHNLEKDEYERKIRKYIQERQPVWRDIVKKIEIAYPFADDDLKNIVIVDTPGVNADGLVGDTTQKNIKDANAVMFLKPMVGASLESTSFRNFLKSNSSDRNRDALFLVLTRAANEQEDDIQRILDEAFNQYSGAIERKHIIPVDNKAELFYKKAKKFNDEELRAYMREMVEQDKLDSFIEASWFRANNNRDEFLKRLRKLSRFADVDHVLNEFAHKAQYIALRDFLNRMFRVMETAAARLNEEIGHYKDKAKDPIELANKMNRLKRELDELTFKLNQTVDQVAGKYSETDGIIDQKSKEGIAEYRAEISKINPENQNSVDELEKITFQKIEQFTQFEKELQEQIVAECDETLLVLSNKSDIPYDTIRPDLTKESFKKIKESIKNSDKAREYYYEEGGCFRKAKSGSYFSQKKYYTAVRDYILNQIASIKNQVRSDLRRFVTETTSKYSTELTQNAKLKKEEYDAIVQEQQTAEEIQKTIGDKENQLNQLEALRERVEEVKKGIERYV